MNWKKFKNKSKDEWVNEAQFILGIDLGNATSAIAYYDIYRGQSEIIDLSGGYGKPSIPTVMQYISETKEWVFGEYAILNRGVGKELTLTALVDRLGRKDFIEADGRAISISGVLALFLKELIGNCKNLNPKAEIVGIVVAIPEFFTQEARNELLMAFKIAGYENEVITLLSGRDCIFRQYFSANAGGIRAEKTLLLDFGSRQLRSGVYEITPETGRVMVKCLSFLQSDDLGVDIVDEMISNMFRQFYADEHGMDIAKLSTQVREQINSFAYQHKDFLFQKNLTAKPIKLYFNFSYPPFQRAVTKAMIDDLISSFEERFREFLFKTLDKNVYNINEKIPVWDIDSVICTGGGFEMLWARNVIKECFPKAGLVTYKNSKCVIAEGASIEAAIRLSIIEGEPVVLEDKLKLNFDMGFKVTKDKREKFVPLVEKNSFWWQSAFSQTFIINEPVDGSYKLAFFKRDDDGEVSMIQEFSLEGLPTRPKGTTCIRVVVAFKSYDRIEANVQDVGFGNLFPASGYAKAFDLKIS